MAISSGSGENASRYIIGVDLGTTHTVLSYIDLDDESGKRAIHLFAPLQITGPGEIAERSVLPSFVYLPGAHELPPGSTNLPWGFTHDAIVGEFAREQGERVPDRLVSSAKSWLSHDRVDRRSPILPWGASAEVPRISPVEASRRYLEHLKEAWDYQIAQGSPEKRFVEQQIVLTVPASFDEAARELTAEAAREAGLRHFSLLEEPLAAFYAWLHDHEERWQARFEPGQVILVCDVGGGTSDFSIIGLQEKAEGLSLERLAVGEHLMLGGDNMDHTLGRYIESKLFPDGGRLDLPRWHRLVHQSRRAKERLLDEKAGRTAAEVTIPGSGSSLIAGILKETLTRTDVERLIEDGFFPVVKLDEPPAGEKSAGLRELGLPYEQDPAITRQLAAFWRRFLPILQEKTGRPIPYPDFILFNGGVFTPKTLRDRVKKVVGGWFASVAGPDWEPTELSAEQLGQAVAIGAAYYGLVRRGEGTRIGSGSPRAYYVGIGRTEEKSIPALCLVPRGAEEGFEARLDNLEVDALTNHPVIFHLYSSPTRQDDSVGTPVDLEKGDVHPLPPIRTVLQFGRKGAARRLPIHLGVRFTETGTLDLWCQSRITDHIWRLQFDVRAEPEDPSDVPLLEDLVDTTRIDAARVYLAETFDAKMPDLDAGSLWHNLERIIGLSRDEWAAPLLRRLADEVLGSPRDRSPRQEEAWFEVLGYALRPGHGDPGDEFRMRQVWKHYMEGLRFPVSVPVRTAWWVFWRRIAGGLTPEKQAQVMHEARPFLQVTVRTKKPHRIYQKNIDPRERRAAFAALAVFERLAPDLKETIGQLVFQHVGKRPPQPAELWALARLGARTPVYGTTDALLPAQRAEEWARNLLDFPVARNRTSALTLTWLTRPTGERGRDVSESVRADVLSFLRVTPEGSDLIGVLTNPHAELSEEDHQWLVGDTEPPAAGTLIDPSGIVLKRPAATLLDLNE